MSIFFKVLSVLILLTGLVAFAEDTSLKQKTEDTVESVKDSTKEAYEDTKKVTKKTYRKAKDKTCEMINGKMECAVDKAKHGLQNTGDEIKDKANDIKRN